MNQDPTRPCVAFAGHEQIASGQLRAVAAAVKNRTDADPESTVIVLDAVTSEIVELDLRGSAGEVDARLRDDTCGDALAGEDGPASEPAPVPARPGRPKLGVVGREVTLLPRHWEWLAAQPGGASVTLRKLVETARLAGGEEQRRRQARDAAYRFMFVVAGDEPGFEEASRALYAGDGARFDGIVADWPADVREHVRRLAADAS